MTYTVDQFGPSDLLTSNKLGTRRIKYDTGKTSFFEAREFRIFKEFDIPAGNTETIKVVATKDTIVEVFSASLVLGALRVELVTGGTDGDDFTENLPIFRTNRTSVAPENESSITMQNGGTHTGGTISDIILLVAGSPARQARETTVTEERPLGFAPGTFYIRLESTGSSNAKGVFRARWEEL